MENVNENNGLNELETSVEQQVDGTAPETPAIETPAPKPAETPAPKVDTVPIHVVEEQREKRREAELRAARAEGELDALRQKEIAQVATQQKSPMQIEAEKNGVDITQPDWEDQVVVTARLSREQYAWLRSQEIQTAKAESIMAAARVHSDFQQVIEQGQFLLTVKERNEVERLTSDYGERGYELCKKALKRAEAEAIPAVPGVPSAIPKVQSATINKKADEPIIPKVPEPPTQDEILSGVSPAIQRAMTF